MSRRIRGILMLSQFIQCSIDLHILFDCTHYIHCKIIYYFYYFIITDTTYTTISFVITNSHLALTAFFFPAAPLKPAFNRSSNPPASAFLTFFGRIGAVLDAGGAEAAAACLAATLACRAAASFSLRFNGSPPCFQKDESTA